MLTGVKVCDAMTTKPVTVPSTLRIDKCAQLMAEHHVGSLLVSEGGKVVGIFTEQDVVRKCVALGLQPWSVHAKDVMSFPLITIRPEEDVFEALRMMADHNVRHLAVRDDRDRFVGFITGKDILKIQPQLFELLAERIQLREANRKPLKTIRMSR